MLDGEIWKTSGIQFSGFGRYFPRELLSNEGVEARHTTETERKVLGSGGVRTHHRAAEDEDIGYMATAAAGAALADAGLDGSEVDVLILSNWTDRWCAPEWGAQVATGIGARHAMGFDICTGCAGFVHGVHTAAMYLAGPAHYRTAVVVCSERFSRRVRPGSKGEMVVGDGAGAVVLRRTGDGGDGDEGGDGPGLIDSIMRSDGTLSHMTTVHPGNGWVRSQPELNEVAVKYVVGAAQELLERNGLRAGDVDWVVPHAATEPFNRGFEADLGIDRARILNNLAERGNTSSASIPTTLSENLEKGVVKRGDLVLSVSLGGGVWCHGGLLYRL
ncbi:ketoacyl-ACP synthase III [Streptomyces carminius]|uniref:Ketoacyl-ACP synthase III n=1 Tax=Streptomyces carminius TaxID=2665496 RepID=A0A2M8LSG9_9ACTN|nr:3-oxoacyl-[acyl-carrier-protein] synthase III C-terminal domain-containing protein [Streptomyces carminius]PJE94910.1 ketoacyl-ACP synthase III [Streptomyces carminius]